MMPSLLLPLCVLLFFGVMALRLALRRPDAAPPRLQRRHLKLARILFAALIAWLVIGYNLKRSEHSLDRKGDYQEGAVERAVRFLAR